MRRNRYANSFLFAAADAVAKSRLAPFDPLWFVPSGYGRYGEGEDTTGGGGGNDTVAGGGNNDDGGGNGGGNPPPANDRNSPQAAFRARDLAKRQTRTLLTMLGYDPKHVKIIPNDDGDEDNPFRFEMDGEDITDQIRAKSKKKSGSQSDTSEIERKYQSRMANAAQAATKRETALINALESVAVLAPLRAAFAANNAVDSGGNAGEYTDLVELSRRYLRTEVARDDDGTIELDADGKITLSIVPLNNDGTPMVEANSQRPVSIEKFVKTFLDKRPAFKKAQKAAGPGAGGHGTNAGGRMASNGDAIAAAAAAGAALFGLKPKDQ